MEKLPDISPEERLLRKEYDELKKKFAGLMLTLREMKQQEEPRLCALYISAFGQQKYDILNLQVEIKTLDMRKQLLQSYINRDQTPDLNEIKSKIDDAVAEYNKILEEEAKKMKAAKEYLESPLMSKEDAAELRTLYRMLVKHLHPDANPEQTEKEHDLFLVVQAAYDHCDLEKLRDICLTLDTKKLVQTEDYLGDIRKYIADLKTKIETVEKNIESLRNTFPYNMKENLADKEWIRQEQEKNEATIAELTATRDRLAAIVEVMEEYKAQKL